MSNKDKDVMIRTREKSLISHKRCHALQSLLSLFVICVLVFNCFGICLDSVQQQKTVLDPENENEARLNRLQPPEKILDIVGVSAGMKVAEIGAGKGRYVVQLAARVGNTGKVYAEDIDAEALDYLKDRCERWDLENVEIILGEATDPRLPQGILDLIFIVSSYHHFDDPVSLLRKARGALKPDGRLAIVEWIPWNKNDDEGTTPQEMEAEMNTAGYQLKRTESLDVAKKLNIYIFWVKDHQNLI
ncbi:MAG: methyltransferase domain-containing protein [Candidatus Aminicenantes bacterium]|nr:methyltransferase domain-containing protein [Candidatus Aminicenantes bacterium]